MKSPCHCRWNWFSTSQPRELLTWKRKGCLKHKAERQRDLVHVGFGRRPTTNDRRRSLIKIRAAQIEPALRTLQLATALAQLCRAVWTILRRIDRLSSRPMPVRLAGRFPCIFFHYAARSLAACAVQFQQSAISNQAPSRRHTRTYFPRSGSMVPSAFLTASEKRPSSIAMSPE